MWEGSQMSVLVVVKIQGDTATFSQALADRNDEFAKISEQARSAGGIHHRFGLGDGFVVLVDEWETAADFEQFFGQPDLQAFMGSVGNHRHRGDHLAGSVLRSGPEGPHLLSGAAAPATGTSTATGIHELVRRSFSCCAG
jgi:hypothetical protein